MFKAMVKRLWMNTYLLKNFQSHGKKFMNEYLLIKGEPLDNKYTCTMASHIYIIQYTVLYTESKNLGL